MSARETIAAVATPPGVGGIGIVRVSGPDVPDIARAISGVLPPPRQAGYHGFRDASGEILDQGILLYFPGPRSFTGEDVLELQAHGGPVLLDRILQRTLELGARPARPGEFSERAFLNGKLDLAQAEGLADLIESATETAARLAVRTLQGELSRRVHAVADSIVALRTLVEATVDFPDEDIDALAGPAAAEALAATIAELHAVLAAARQGQLLRDGMTLVIAGLPNAGKSSLLNALAGYPAAIVTHVPGTTRDLLRERIQLDGLPLHVIDTAGLRDGADVVEREGVRRAREELGRADRVLWVFDDQADPGNTGVHDAALPPGVPVTFVRNKIDLRGAEPFVRETPDGAEVALAAATGAGLELLREHLKACVGYQGPTEGELMARRRHLDALRRCRDHLQAAQRLASAADVAELLAEELRLAHACLGEITGEFLPEDLLGEIFSSFCIGK